MSVNFFLLTITLFTYTFSFPQFGIGKNEKTLNKILPHRQKFGVILNIKVRCNALAQDLKGLNGAHTQASTFFFLGFLNFFFFDK